MPMNIDNKRMLDTRRRVITRIVRVRQEEELFTIFDGNNKNNNKKKNSKEG